jgi:hypothetical protein
MVWPFSSTETPSNNPQEQRPVESAKKVVERVDESEDTAQTRSSRGRKVNDAINENCALQSLALLDCQDSWSLWNRFTLCQPFQSRYMDCLNTQRVQLSPELSPTDLDITIANGIWKDGKYAGGRRID